MKRLTTVSILAMLLFLPLFAMAANHNATIRIYDPVQVAGTKLQPGRYKIDWTGTGPSVQVAFQRNGHTVVTAPATLKMQSNPYNKAIDTSKSNGQRTLNAVLFTHETLSFRAPATASR